MYKTHRKGREFGLLSDGAVVLLHKAAVGAAFEATMNGSRLQRAGPPVCVEGKVRGDRKAT